MLEKCGVIELVIATLKQQNLDTNPYTSKRKSMAEAAMRVLQLYGLAGGRHPETIPVVVRLMRHLDNQTGVVDWAARVLLDSNDGTTYFQSSTLIKALMACLCLSFRRYLA